MRPITNGVKTPRSLSVIPLYFIEKNSISCQWRKVKVKSFPGATIEDMYDDIIDNTVNKTSRIVLDKLSSLKVFVEKALPDCLHF